jgi:hypothetical protein
MSRRSKASSVSTLQPDLFAFGMSPQPEPVVRDRNANPVAPKFPVIARSIVTTAVSSTPTPRTKRPSAASARRETRSVSVADLPDYPPLDQELVDRSIAALPPNRIWFTYRAIKECFGVSRATVARKVQQGLVPGIRFRGASVLPDGPVRRFDRNQLRWLLLALRSH